MRSPCSLCQSLDHGVWFCKHFYDKGVDDRRRFDGLYLFILFYFVYLLLYQVYDIYVHQCICCASFLTLTFLIIIITVTQLV